MFPFTDNPAEVICARPGSWVFKKPFASTTPGTMELYQLRMLGCVMNTNWAWAKAVAKHSNKHGTARGDRSAIVTMVKPGRLDGPL